MRKILYSFCCVLAVMAAAVSCQKHTYDFTWSPNNPKAGEKVTFTNISDAGENWTWSFGDGSKSTIKNATHTFTSAGTFTVQLMVDSNKTRVISHVIDVLDSVPTIYVKSDTVPQYTQVVIRADYYNPSKSTVTFAWTVDENLLVLTDGDLTSDSLTGYFTGYDRTTEIGLTLTVGTKTTELRHTLTLVDKVAPSLTMQTADGKLWRQRIYDGMFEDANIYDGDLSIIAPANDSTAVLNGVTYDIHAMPVLTDKTVNALQVDAVNRKLYLILDDGVYVANANGDALTRIIETTAFTLLIDAERNTIYWSDSEGVKAMPLVTNPQNTVSEQLRNKIKQVNSVANVERMIISL